MAPTCQIEPTNCVATAGFQSVCGAAANSCAFSPIVAGGLKARHAIGAGAEREAIVAGQQRLQGCGKATHQANQAQLCLTPRSRRGPTAGHQARDAARHIICIAGLASHRWPRLTSNVRRWLPRANPALSGLFIREVLLHARLSLASFGAGTCRLAPSVRWPPSARPPGACQHRVPSHHLLPAIGSHRPFVAR